MAFSDSLGNLYPLIGFSSHYTQSVIPTHRSTIFYAKVKELVVLIIPHPIIGDTSSEPCTSFDLIVIVLTSNMHPMLSIQVLLSC